MQKIILAQDEKIEEISQNFGIIQSDSLPKFGVDAFLLADFADKSLSATQIVADFGSGTGAIGLLYALKTFGKIFLIEKDEKLSRMAAKSIQLDNLSNRVQSINRDVNQLEDTFAINSLDTIVANPPYFDSVNYAQKNTSERRALARHEESFNLQVLVDQSQKYLKSKGKLYFIYRAERIAEVISILQASHFGITKIRFVYGKKNHEAKLVLIKANKQGSNDKIKVDKPLAIFNEKDQYTNEMKDVLHRRPYFFYVIQTADNYLYAGTSDDVDRRFATHQAKKGAKFTKAAIHHPLKLVYRQEFSNKGEALSFEIKFKKFSRANKEKYINL